MAVDVELERFGEVWVNRRGPTACKFGGGRGDGDGEVLRADAKLRLVAVGATL